uniref:60S ribosomal export protein NMD3 n=1 Tax=Cajanus cajan TaxID=3821 RepID=A0A151SQS7_CAJCA|nr:60S ribosomal export protein NMD3 [Cajanus cajan]
MFGSSGMAEEAGMFKVHQTIGSVLCCKCGIPMQPNAANMCVKCLRSEVDITEGLLKRLKNLNSNKVRLVHAEFIWTEPHSKRVKVRVKVQKEQMEQGIDFFFSNRSHGVKFVEFIGKVAPVKSRHDKQLVSHDPKSNNYNYKYTFSVELSPICREDLICLPPKVAVSLGNIGPIVICTKVTNSIALLDPFTLRHSDAQVARVSDFGKNDTIFNVKTHLGHLLNPGDYALGYDLYGANSNDMELDKYRGLVDDKARVDQDKMVSEYEQFLKDLEENPDMRFNISLYRNAEYQPSEMASVTDGDELPSVPLEELLADLDLSEDEDGEDNMME